MCGCVVGSGVGLYGGSVSLSGSLNKKKKSSLSWPPPFKFQPQHDSSLFLPLLPPSSHCYLADYRRALQAVSKIFKYRYIFIMAYLEISHVKISKFGAPKILHFPWPSWGTLGFYLLHCFSLLCVPKTDTDAQYVLENHLMDESSGKMASW